MSPDAAAAKPAEPMIDNATWIQSYLEALGNLPYRVGHWLSEILMLDSYFYGGISQVQTLEERFRRSEQNSEGSARMQQKTYERMKYVLAHLQLLVDQKLDALEKVTDVVDSTLQRFAMDPDTSRLEAEKQAAAAAAAIESSKRSEDASESPSPVKLPTNGNNHSTNGNNHNNIQNNSNNNNHNHNNNNSHNHGQSNGNGSDKEKQQAVRKATKKFRRQRFYNDCQHDGDSSDKAEKTHHAQTGCHRKRKKQKTDDDMRVRFDMPIDPNEPTYCLCEQVSYGEMICCDNTNCLIEWFHFNCVDLITKPKGKWYCPNCRGDRANVLKSRS